MFCHIVSCSCHKQQFETKSHISQSSQSATSNCSVSSSSELRLCRPMMRLIKIILCWCCVFAGHFLNGRSIHSSEIKSRLINHTKELIDRVFVNNSNPLIISSDLVDHQVASGNIDNGNPVIVMNYDSSERGIEIKGYLPSYPTYVLRYESLQKLMLLTLTFMTSSTWNIKSPIFILNISKKRHDVKAFEVLSFLGHFDTLLSYYMCYDYGKNSTIVYTLNPFTQYAPSPWNQVKFSNSNINNKTKLTLYSLQYPKANLIEQEKIYDVLKYMVKTKDYGLASLPDYMNVTASIDILKNSFNSDTIIYGYDRGLATRRYDASNTKSQLADTNPKLIDFVTEYHEMHYSIMTKKTNYLTVVTEIHINLQFIFITLLVLLLIAVIIIMNNKFNVSQGIMDIVSISLSMGIISPMNRLSMRIIYFFGFLFIFVVMPEFRGQISAILSQPARRNVETLKDLFDNKYHVFYNGFLENDMINEKLWVTEEDQKYLHPSSHTVLKKCVKEAQQNSTIACIDYTMHQLLYALELKNLYVSKDKVFKKYYVYWIRKNWALKEKINKVRSISVETGLINCYHEKIVDNRRKRINKMEKIKEAENYEWMDFDNLLFYLIVFVATLLWSLVIFGIELIIYHSHSKYIR
ncbi:odorant binding protein 9 isoform X2 [Cotesia typhae]|uniref:odorant binding protein 9 isoform X2 n=1 Tax=Cotesia typhae TaxID=2053667 RepID=UPI003D68CBA3